MAQGRDLADDVDSRQRLEVAASFFNAPLPRCTQCRGQDATSAANEEETPLVIAPEVQQAFDKIAVRLKSAKSTRATVELTSRALSGEEELQAEFRSIRSSLRPLTDSLFFSKVPGNFFASMPTASRHPSLLPMTPTCNSVA